MFSLESSGSFENTENFLNRMSKGDIFRSLNNYGQKGVTALASMTPKESGETAASWSYEVERSRSSYSIIWTNSKIVGGTPLAVMLQVGHGTGTGGYVTGIDYINPALAPIFRQIAEDVWKEVTA